MLSNGYTYSYFHTEPKNGEKCCRSVKAKCEVNEDSEKICECWRGPNVCGKNCSQIVAKLEKLDEGHEKINNELEKLDEGHEKKHRKNSKCCPLSLLL